MRNAINNLFKKLPKRPVLLVLLVLALSIGAYFATAKHNDPSSPAKNGTTANLSGNNRADLIDLADKNLVQTNKAINAMLDVAPDASSQKQAAYDSQVKLGGAIGNLYDEKAEAEFNKYWKVYMDQSFKYAMAAKTGDQEAKDAATAEMYDNFAVPLSDYVHKINPAATQITIRSGLTILAQDMTYMIDRHVAGETDLEKEQLQRTQVSYESVLGFVADGARKGKYVKNVNGISNDPTKQDKKK